MTNMNEVIENLNQVIKNFKSDLGEGLVGTGIWHTSDGQQIAEYKSRPKAVALFNEVTRIMDNTLRNAEFPNLGQYYLVHLKNNHVVIVVKIGEYQQGALVDLSKTTMGILMSVALPRLLKDLKEVTVKLPR